MRRGHRAAHPGVVLASGALAAGMFCYGWSIRAGRPSVEPVAAPAPPPGAAWEVAIRTPDGVATVSYFDAGPAGDEGPFLWASLPAGLDAAEPGLILELENEPPRVLGSIAPGLPAVPVPGGLAPGGRDAGDGRLRPAGGGRLVLVDLARELRLGWADLPGGPR